MKNPTYPRLENLVNRMVDERVKKDNLVIARLPSVIYKLLKKPFDGTQGNLPPTSGISETRPKRIKKATRMKLI